MVRNYKYKKNYQLIPSSFPPLYSIWNFKAIVMNTFSWTLLVLLRCTIFQYWRFLHFSKEIVYSIVWSSHSRWNWFSSIISCSGMWLSYNPPLRILWSSPWPYKEIAKLSLWHLPFFTFPLELLCKKSFPKPKNRICLCLPSQSFAFSLSTSCKHFFEP